MKNVLLLGASGYIAPHIIPGLEPYYHLRLADVKPHPDGKPVIPVDVTSYAEVFEASHGMDAIMNFTVNRYDLAQSFHVNIIGAYHVMKAAAEHGIKKVIHTGPQLMMSAYGHDFDVDDVPPRPGTQNYFLTKYLSMEVCKIYSQAYDIQTICFLLCSFRPKPTEPVSGRDFQPFVVTWEDMQYACRLALDIDRVPGNFQSLNMSSYLAQGKIRIDKAKRILGYSPLEEVEQYFKRTTTK